LTKIAQNYKILLNYANFHRKNHKYGIFILHICKKSCTFAANMRNRYFLLLLLALVAGHISAAVVTLQNGQKIQGEIVVQNEEIVIIKNANGQRFQYPPQEIVSITDEAAEVAPVEQTQTDTKLTGKKTVFYLSFQGGGAFVSQVANGGVLGGELMIGSRYIGSRHIFIGGGIGVNGVLLPDRPSYVYLPLQVAVKVPIIEGKHAPFVGANIGYGFALSKNCSGGIYTSFEVGYRYQAGPMTTIFASLCTQFQQTKMEVTEVIEQSEYQDYAGRNIVTFGAKIGLSF